MTRIKDKASKHGVFIIATIYEEDSPGICDTAMAVNPQGQIVVKYHKSHPAGYRALELIYYRWL